MNLMILFTKDAQRDLLLLALNFLQFDFFVHRLHDLVGLFLVELRTIMRVGEVRDRHLYEGVQTTLQALQREVRHDVVHVDDGLLVQLPEIFTSKALPLIQILHHSLVD